jgi:hypothetical protein
MRKVKHFLYSSEGGINFDKWARAVVPSLRKLKNLLNVLLVAAVIVNVNHYQTYQLLLDFYVTLTPLVLSGTPAQSQGYCAIPGHKQILSNVDL